MMGRGTELDETLYWAQLSGDTTRTTKRTSMHSPVVHLCHVPSFFHGYACHGIKIGNLLKETKMKY
jgi:hypothetical protein